MRFGESARSAAEHKPTFISYIAAALLPFPARLSCHCESHISVCRLCKSDSKPQKSGVRLPYLVLTGRYLLLEQERLLFQGQTLLQQLLVIPQPVLLEQQPLHLDKSRNVTLEGGAAGEGLPPPSSSLPGCRGWSASAEAASLRQQPLVCQRFHTAPGQRSNACWSPPGGWTRRESPPPERRGHVEE